MASVSIHYIHGVLVGTIPYTTVQSPGSTTVKLDGYITQTSQRYYIEGTALGESSSTRPQSGWHEPESSGDTIGSVSKATTAKTVYVWAKMLDANTDTYVYASSDETISIPALDSYDVTFDPNGGAGTMLKQEKFYGIALTLSANQFIRTGFVFDGWNTKADGTGTSYSDGASYSGNAAVTLYAKWKRNIDSVAIGDAEAVRVDTSSSTTESDEGTYAYITVPYSVSGAAAASVALSVTATADSGTDPTVTVVSGTATKLADTPCAGTFTARLSGCATDVRYTVDVAVTATNTSVTQADVEDARTMLIPTAFYTIKVKPGGHGIAFGAPSLDDTFHVAMPSKFTNDATFLDDVKVGSTIANAKKMLPYLVFDSLSWTSANLSACQAAVADYRPCVARFSNGAVVEFDDDPQTDVYS